MSVREALYPRGKVAGPYPALPTRADEAYVDFIADARNFLLHAQQRPIGAYSRELTRAAGLSSSPDPDNTRRATELLMRDPTLRTYYRVKRSLQEAFWSRLLAAFGGRRELLMNALAEADRRGPGSVEYDLEAPVPEYAQTQIHLQPGGYCGEPLAGVLYDFGLKVFMGGAADDDAVANMAARAAAVPADGQVRRILDLGCSAGATTTALKGAWPEAEVHGIDISAHMVRYAHLRAMEQGVDVHFKQMPAESLRYPEGNFDMVLAMLLFHEIPTPIARHVIAEAFRVLRPGGTFTILDFGGDRGSDVYSMFFAEMDAADNGEPYLTEYRRSNVEDLMQEAGFELRPYDPRDPGAGLRSGRVGAKP
jgi:SAM-dependent methyltransferase